MVLLGVNVDHVATLRQARGGRQPDPLMGATLALLGGADGITVHLREDRRHINDRDLRLMRELVSTELNMEMAPVREMVKIALEVKPEMATLVPEKRRELTTEGGLDTKGDFKKIADAVGRLKDGGLLVSLFIDPDEKTAEWAAKTGADMVELHTGYYSNARTAARRKEMLERLRSVSALAGSAGLMVNAGHGLDYSNVGPVAAFPGLRGLYIGHGIVGMAVLVGMKEAVARMKALIAEAAVR